MNFGEKKEEYSVKQGRNIPVWVSPKYEQSRAAAIKIIEQYEDVKESDFWILMNETKSGKMGYTGLIISHNGCLKINDSLKPEEQFRPECLSIDKDGYKGSLVYSYCCPNQGIYEVGEVSDKNCKNAYPYAMALKRCFDRVVLKVSKLAYGEIYSESEADEFREPTDEPKKGRPQYIKEITLLIAQKGYEESEVFAKIGVEKLADLETERMPGCIDWLKTLKPKGER